MKKIFLTSLFLVSTIVLLTNCKKEKAESNVTDQINKIETKLKPNDTKIENQIIGIAKNETDAPAEYKESIKNALENSFSKITQKSAGTLVGVLKNASTCGSYRELQVYMDCEDYKPNSNKSAGCPSNSYIDGNGNINLYFCVVDGTNFQSVHAGSYAVLKLDANSPSSSNKIVKRYFDNQDTNNWQWIIDNGTFISAGTTIGDCTFGQNTLLSFYYFPVSPIETGTTFPDLGISYCALGAINGHVNGWISSDDEDSSNANWATYWDGTTTNNITNMPGIFDGGRNTTLYITQIR